MTVNTGVVINLNNTSIGASFVTGTGYDQAVTILHELGHAYWDSYGSGTSKITPDGSDLVLSQANDKKVRDNCK